LEFGDASPASFVLRTMFICRNHPWQRRIALRHGAPTAADGSSSNASALIAWCN
jgi:hypothetical protein